MIRKLSIIALVLFLASSAFSMPKLNANFDNDRRAEPATSFVFGAQGDFNKLGQSGTDWSFLVGLAKPVAANGKFYWLNFGEMGKTSEGEQYGAVSRLIYYLKEPGTGFSVGIIVGPGATWIPTDRPLTKAERIAYLYGASGVLVSVPTELLGFWGGIEYQRGKDFSTYRAAIGINFFP